jgi:hypothetical protein
VTPPEYDYQVDDLDGWIASLAKAKQKVEEWQGAVAKIQDFIETQLRAEVADDAVKDATGKRVIYGTVNGKRKIRITEYEQRSFLKDKFGENHPDLLEQYTMKVPNKRFSILDK